MKLASVNTTLFLTISTIFGLAGCSGGGDSSIPDTSGANTGIFVDSPVSNIGYKTETLEGVTNSLGEYEYNDGETVTFFIGDLVFPSVLATDIVSPLNIVQTLDTSDPTVINMIRLLQTLDTDGNPDNGITISDTAKSTATQVDFTLSETDFESSSAVVSLISNAGQDITVTALVSTTDAIAHFEQELAPALAIIGSWYLEIASEVNPDVNDHVVLTFFANGYYHMAQDGLIDTFHNGTSGMEWGTYSYNGTTLIADALLDTNETWGFSHPENGIPGQFIADVTVTGDVFTFVAGELDVTDVDLDLARVNSSSIVGGWLNGDSNTSDAVSMTFLNNGTFMLIHGIGEPASITCVECGPGIEFGSYVWNADTDALSYNILTDTTGEGGLSHSDIFSASVNGDTMTFTSSSEAPLDVTRIK